VKYFPLLWAGLWRKKTRTVLTLLSVVIAFLLFGLLQGVNAWLSNSVRDSRTSRLYTVSKISYIEPLPASYLQRIESVPGVTAVATNDWFGGYYRESKNSITSYPVDPVRFFKVFSDWNIPKEQLEAFARTPNGAVVGGVLANKYGWKIGDRIPLKTSIWTKKDGTLNYDFELVGIFTVPAQPSNEQIFLMNYQYFNESRQFGQDNVGWFSFLIDDPTKASAIAKQIDAMFANSPNETKTQNEQEFAQATIKQLGDISFMVNAIVGAVMFTLLFLTGNTMMQSLRERIPEFAVLKTLGFTDGAVTTMVLTESILLCVIAALVGLGLAAMIFPVTRALIGFQILMPLSVFGIGAVAATALALLSGLPPALRAHRLPVVDALAGR
jgi:putative ABC transport system permease protein